MKNNSLIWQFFPSILEFFGLILVLISYAYNKDEKCHIFFLLFSQVVKIVSYQVWKRYCSIKIRAQELIIYEDTIIMYTYFPGLDKLLKHI